jgi:hypothetical protein
MPNEYTRGAVYEFYAHYDERLQAWVLETSDDVRFSYQVPHPVALRNGETLGMPDGNDGRLVYARIVAPAWVRVYRRLRRGVGRLLRVVSAGRWAMSRIRFGGRQLASWKKESSQPGQKHHQCRLPALSQPGVYTNRLPTILTRADGVRPAWSARRPTLYGAIRKHSTRFQLGMQSSSSGLMRLGMIFARRHSVLSKHSKLPCWRQSQRPRRLTRRFRDATVHELPRLVQRECDASSDPNAPSALRQAHHPFRAASRLVQQARPGCAGRRCVPQHTLRGRCEAHRPAGRWRRGRERARPGERHRRRPRRLIRRRAPLDGTQL